MQIKHPFSYPTQQFPQHYTKIISNTTQNTIDQCRKKPQNSSKPQTKTKNKTIHSTQRNDQPTLTHKTITSSHQEQSTQQPRTPPDAKFRALFSGGVTLKPSCQKKQKN